MMKESSLLYIGLADFAEPTLLLIGDTTSLSWLADQIDACQKVELAEIKGCISKKETRLNLIPVAHSGCLRRQEKGFKWEISAMEARLFANQLRELAANASPAHAYLDPECNAAEVQVIASKGEYDPEKVFFT